MSEFRVGLGVDLHRFADEVGAGDRPLVLGGARLAGERALVGHSDADAIAHAVADAVLGAAGLGDMGSHFPDTDPAWRDADSLELLSAVMVKVAAQGWRLVNADCTLVAEHPRVAEVRGEMVRRLSAAAGGQVHVKATRPEGLGSLGRAEGVVCLAVALLER
ncbi:MAG: 2-C-methyl-D-erythritol 2,4-cyclodiphosphate synthase [Acidimicrobiales bacterium]